MKQRRRTQVKVVAIVVLSVILITLVWSQNSTPGFLPLFQLKRVQETVNLSLKTSPESKLEYMLVLQEHRLRELEKMVKSENYDYILPAASRYSTLAGQIVAYANTNHLSSKNEGIKKQFTDHQVVLKEIYDIYPKNTENQEYKYIEDDINYLKVYATQLEGN